MYVSAPGRKRRPSTERRGGGLESTAMVAEKTSWVVAASVPAWGEIMRAGVTRLRGGPRVRGRRGYAPRHVLDEEWRQQAARNVAAIWGLWRHHRRERFARVARAGNGRAIYSSFARARRGARRARHDDASGRRVVVSDPVTRMRRVPPRRAAEGARRRGVARGRRGRARRGARSRVGFRTRRSRASRARAGGRRRGRGRGRRGR